MPLGGGKVGRPVMRRARAGACGAPRTRRARVLASIVQLAPRWRRSWETAATRRMVGLSAGLRNESPTRREIVCARPSPPSGMAFAVAALAYVLRPPPGAVTTPPALCTRVATRVRLRLLDSATAATGTDGFATAATDAAAGFATAATETVGVATAATAATGTAGFATAVANAAGFAAPEHACPQCGQPHPSRNQLYAHLRANRATCGDASGLELASGAPVRLRKHVLSVGYGACGGEPRLVPHVLTVYTLSTTVYTPSTYLPSTHYVQAAVRRPH